MQIQHKRFINKRHSMTTSSSQCYMLACASYVPVGLENDRKHKRPEKLLI
jgi:hypothetical protein